MGDVPQAAIAVEARDKAFGRCRLRVVDKIDSAHLGEFLHRHIAPGSVVISDALRSCPLAIADTYGHKPFNIKRSGLHAHEVLPAVHRVAASVRSCRRAGGLELARRLPSPIPPGPFDAVC